MLVLILIVNFSNWIKKVTMKMKKNNFFNGNGENPNTLPNSKPNSHRHFFELVEKYDDDNLEN
jgi:hypothetical protein